MKFLKYLLSCFTNVVDKANDPTPTEEVLNQITIVKDTKTKWKEFLEGLVFILEILVFVAIFATYGFGLFNKIINNEILVWILTMLATIATILTFCLACIIIELFIKIIKKWFVKN